MSGSRFGSRHPMFFYRQLKAKVDQVNLAELPEAEEAFIQFVINLFNEKWISLNEIKSLAALSISLRRAVLDAVPCLPPSLAIKHYEQEYMRLRGDFNLALTGRARRSRENYDSYGTPCQGFLYAAVTMNFFIIISSFVSSYLQLKPNPQHGQCASLRDCDWSKTLKGPPVITMSMFFEFAAAGLVLGLVVGYLIRVFLANDHVRNRDALAAYQGRLFAPSAELAVEDKLDNLMAFQEEYAREHRWTQLIARPRE